MDLELFPLSFNRWAVCICLCVCVTHLGFGVEMCIIKIATKYSLSLCAFHFSLLTCWPLSSLFTPSFLRVLLPPVVPLYSYVLLTLCLRCHLELLIYSSFIWQKYTRSYKFRWSYVQGTCAWSEECIRCPIKIMCLGKSF